MSKRSFNHPYPSDLCDKEWELIKPYFADLKTNLGRKRVHSYREILNAIFYLLRSGCAWRISGSVLASIWNDNAIVQASQENQNSSTLAQMLGGISIAISLYYTWRRIGIAEEDLKATKEGQITERFTRAIDQLGVLIP